MPPNSVEKVNPESNTSQTLRQPKILIVDDDPIILELLTSWLQKDYETQTVENGKDAITRLSTFNPDLVITDLRMKEMDGIALLTEIQQYNSVLPVIMLSGSAHISDAVRAAHQGIYEFLTKPVDPEALFTCVKSALNHIRTAHGENTFAPDIIHQSAIMANLLKQAERVAKTRSSVFIGGATGTGKEMLAKAIHKSSPRADQIFMAVNCGALSEQLLESELFGHEKGAFTGAVKKNLGLFQAANGGTVFLDEIGDMPGTLQVKLLRVLQEGQVKPVGSIQSIDVDVRVISATHQDLDLAIRRGEFREDLFYRLNVIPLHMPSLSERQEDIPLLIEHFLALQAQRDETEDMPRFSPEALDYMVTFPWPGNVRQLQNIVEQCSVLATSPIIPLSLVKHALREDVNKFQTLEEARKEFDKIYLTRVLRMWEGEITGATRAAGYTNIDEFKQLLVRYNIDPVDFRHANSEDAASEEGDSMFQR